MVVTTKPAVYKAVEHFQPPIKPEIKSKPDQKWQNFGIGILITVIIGIIAMFLAPLPGLTLMGSLTIAMLLGIVWRNLFGLSKAYTPGIQFSAKKILRFGIILAGVRLNFGLVASSGLQVLLLDAILIGFGIVFIAWLGRKAGLSSGLSTLIAVGQSICGASAVSVAASVTPNVKEEEISLGVAICGIVGTLGVLFFTFAVNIFHWQSHFYGLLSGSTLHEIAQVVAAGPAGGENAADLAMVVKLTRVMLLAPVALVLALFFTLKTKTTNPGFSWKKFPFPYFVLGFLAVGVINSLGWFSKDIANIILQISIFLMIMAMAAMGLQLDLKVIRKIGLKALAVATLAFVIFIVVSMLLIFSFGMA